MYPYTMKTSGAYFRSVYSAVSGKWPGKIADLAAVLLLQARLQRLLRAVLDMQKH